MSSPEKAFQSSNNDAWDSLPSNSRSVRGNIDDYPLLKSIARHLVLLHTSSIEDNFVEALASGKILCDILSDYVGGEMIDSYHTDAKADSSQAEENLSSFAVACEKIQIPRSCMATTKDFRNGNYEKIELMLVLFMIRGMAYSIPQVPDETLNDLRNYKLPASIPHSEHDRKACERILDVFVNHNNDKTIPIQDSQSESDSQSEEEKKRQMFTDEVNFDTVENTEEKQADDEDAVDEVPVPLKLSDSDHAEDTVLPADGEGDDVDEVPMPEMDAHPVECDSLSQNSSNPSHPDVGDEVDEVDAHPDEASQEEVPEVAPVNEAIDDEVDEVPEPSQPVAQSESAVDEVPEPSQPVTQSESAVDEVPEVPVVSFEAIGDDDVDEVVNDDLQGPEEDVNPMDDVVIGSNDPVGFNINNRETEEETRQREEEEKKRKQQLKEEKKKKKEEERKKKMEERLQRYNNNSLPKTEDTFSQIATPKKRDVKWYVVLILVLLMLVCLAGIIGCGWMIAYVNK